jgi:hypothetical protein
MDGSFVAPPMRQENSRRGQYEAARKVALQVRPFCISSEG